MFTENVYNDKIVYGLHQSKHFIPLPASFLKNLHITVTNSGARKQDSKKLTQDHTVGSARPGLSRTKPVLSILIRLYPKEKGTKHYIGVDHIQ